MKLSLTLGMTACAALMAVSGIASAASVMYDADGYVTAATDGAKYPGFCALYGQAVGTHSTPNFYYPGAGVPGMALESAGTAATANKSNSGVTYSCISSNPSPTLKAGTTTLPITFVCTGDNMSGPGSTVAFFTQTMKVSAIGGGATTSKNFLVETTSTYLDGSFQTICTATNQSTWTAH